MALLLFDRWKRQTGGPQDASAFLLVLVSDASSAKEKGVIINALNDWEVLTPTWFEVADYVHFIEKLSEDEEFPGRFRAALLASKVHYCLGDYDSALQYALAAEDEFQLTSRLSSTLVKPQDEQYINKMVEHALDTYKLDRRTGGKNELLKGLVNRIFDRNMRKKEIRYVIKLALDTHRFDMIIAAIAAADDKAPLLAETIAKVIELQMDKPFRSIVLAILLRLFSMQSQPDFVAISQCLIRLEKPVDVAKILCRLATSQDTSSLLLAYQVAFDLYENASQQFINKVERALSRESPSKQASASSASAEDAEASSPKEKPNEVEESVEDLETMLGQMCDETDDASLLSFLKQPHALISDPAANGPIAARKIEGIVGKHLRSILSGEQTIEHYMRFLKKNNHTDILILEQMKDNVKTESARNATIIANGLMHLGTTADDFLSDNMEWISEAVNWNKFNAIASIGLIHKGHEASARKVLDPYLPRSKTDAFGFKEGGALYAYGLIYANHRNDEVISYLCEQLSDQNTSAVVHGACLGLGLAAMGTSDEKVCDQLRSRLYKDNAVVGEAAGAAIGLVCAGSLQEKVLEEMIQYALDTQHDKIQRGIRTGIALLAYRHQESVETWVEQLLKHKSNPMLRSTAVCMLAMAYAGSGKPEIVGRLLAMVATDPSQDVKRFAVIAIGFVLSNDPEQCMSYIGMLLEHYSPHVRYGAAVALGISCAGSGHTEAVSLLEPLLFAKENFVRQGAILALSFILIQQTDATSPNVNRFRKILSKVITKKGADSSTKFGAILAQGILNAGGRNVTISLHNRNGHSDMQSVVGIFVFLQYWYWHSFALFLSLAFKPTCVIGLNIDLKVPETEFCSNSKLSVFAYPPPLKEEKKEEPGKVQTACLSVTAKNMSITERKEKKEKARQNSKETLGSSSETTSENQRALRSKRTAEQKEPEPLTHNLQNPARVVPSQLKTLQMPENTRYKPVKALSQGGIIMLYEKKMGPE